MRTVKKEEQKESKKLEEVFALWKKKARSGLDYLTGKTTDNTNLVAYYNTNKKNPKEPDIRVYVSNDGKTGEEVASLWESISKKDEKTRYLTGTTNEKEKLVAFYEESENEKRPYIKAYFQD